MRVPETDGKMALLFRMTRIIDRRRRRQYGGWNPIGIKAWFIPGTTFEGEGTMTRWAQKERKRRRSARKVARESRRRNRP